ncbi:hypothetical protein D3C87_2090130 [compost metagenome]
MQLAVAERDDAGVGMEGAAHHLGVAGGVALQVVLDRGQGGGVAGSQAGCTVGHGLLQNWGGAEGTRPLR